MISPWVGMILTTQGAMGVQPPAEWPTPRGYVCHRAGGPVAIDGKLDDAAWQRAPWTEPFVDIEGDMRPRPTYETRAKMLWDDEYLYIGALLREPHVWATLTEHDSVIFQDPDFEVFIDPDSDNHDYYEIEVNAFGTEWDLRLVKPYKDGGPALDEWEIPGLRVATHVEGTTNDPSDEDSYWSVEFAFPWSVLAEHAKCPSPPRHGDQWRVGFSRVEWDIEIVDGGYRKIEGKPEHNWIWSPQGVIDMHRPETWGYVQFSTAEPGADTFRRDPTEPVRLRLHRAYYALRSFREQQKRWPADLAEAGVEIDAEYVPAADGYTLSADAGDGSGRRVTIRQDALVWVE